MSNKLNRWKDGSIDFNRKEREAEREWVWILLELQISGVLEDSGGVRSLASHWGRFSRDFAIQTFLLKDLIELVSDFKDHLAAKKKAFPDDDVYPFVAWKCWEAKIQCRNIVSPEIYPITVQWQSGKVQYAGLFEAVNRAFKLIKNGFVERFYLDKISPVYPPKTDEQKKAFQKAKEDFSDIIAVTAREVVEELLKKNPSILSGYDTRQIEGEKE